MDRFFAPRSLAIYGLSRRPGNTARIILDNCRRWGFRGPIVGINPQAADDARDDLDIRASATDLPFPPDLAVLLVPARHVPAAVEDCGRAGIRRLAIQAGGFNESSEAGLQLAEQVRAAARRHAIRFVGPNGLALADTTSGLCLPFVPALPVRPGSFSFISQSGGLGLFLWNLLESEQLGLARFASIGNRLDLDEVDFLEFLGADPATRVIGLYLESIADGRRLIEAAARAGKPVIVYKANTTDGGGRAAMSHTASLGGDDRVVDAAFARAGIIRIHRFRDFVTTARAFDLPPMRGRRIMLMSPAGGLGVAMADRSERRGFAFADPGEPFYRELATIANAGIIRPGNPLDLGDLYRVDRYPALFEGVLASDRVDGAVFASQWPRMPPGGTDVFTGMFTTDFYTAAAEVARRADKPLALALYGHPPALAELKERLPVPVFAGPEEALDALERQMRYHEQQTAAPFAPDPVPEVDRQAAAAWLAGRDGAVGEEALALVACCGLAGLGSAVARTPAEAGRLAAAMGCPVVLKVVAAGVLHKTEVGGVLVGIDSPEEAERGFATIRANLARHRPEAELAGVRIAPMAPAGHDLFIGGLQDPVFGPVVVFGSGGVYVELFVDVARLLCPTAEAEVRAALGRLRCARLFAGFRGRPAVDPGPFTRAVVRVGQLLADCPEIAELDLNPVRLTDDGRLLALDARLRLAGPG